MPRIFAALVFLTLLASGPLVGPTAAQEAAQGGADGGLLGL
jgi:hypothetical protein